MAHLGDFSALMDRAGDVHADETECDSHGVVAVMLQRLDAAFLLLFAG